MKQPPLPSGGGSYTRDDKGKLLKVGVDKTAPKTKVKPRPKAPKKEA